MIVAHRCRPGARTPTTAVQIGSGATISGGAYPPHTPCSSFRPLGVRPTREGSNGMGAEEAYGNSHIGRGMSRDLLHGFEQLNLQNSDGATLWWNSRTIHGCSVCRAPHGYMPIFLLYRNT